MLAGVSLGNPVQSGSDLRISLSTSAVVAPANAGRPASISYSTHPNAHTSVVRSTSSPFACSELM